MTKTNRTIEVAVLGICIALGASFLLDVVTAAWPARWVSPNWRWGLVGFAATRLPLLVLGCCALLTCLVLVERPAGARTLSLLVSGFGAVLVLAAGVFIVDGMSIAAVTESGDLWAMRRSNILTLPSLLLGAIALLWSGRAARRATTP